MVLIERARRALRAKQYPTFNHASHQRNQQAGLLWFCFGIRVSGGRSRVWIGEAHTDSLGFSGGGAQV